MLKVEFVIEGKNPRGVFIFGAFYPCACSRPQVLVIRAVAGSVRALALPRPRSDLSEPLLDDHKWQSEDSDQDSNVVLFEVMQRRDAR